MKQAVGFSREVPLLALPTHPTPPLPALMAAACDRGRESWGNGAQKHGCSSPLSLILSQPPGGPTAIAQARKDDSPNVPSLPPSQAHSAFTHASYTTALPCTAPPPPPNSTGTPSPATMSGARFHTPPFTPQLWSASQEGKVCAPSAPLPDLSSLTGSFWPPFAQFRPRERRKA